MKEIINLSLGSAIDNYDVEIKILDQNFRIKRLGVDFDLELLKQLITKYKNTADIFAISGFPAKVKIDGESIEHRTVKEIKDLASPIPVLDGSGFREVYQPWYIDRLSRKIPGFFKGKKIGFFAGFIQSKVIEDLEKFDCEFCMADPFFLYKTPVVLNNRKSLNQFLRANLKVLSLLPLKSFRKRNFNATWLKKVPGFKKFFDCDIYFINGTQLDYIQLPSLTGKTVIVDHLNQENEKQLKDAGAKNIITLTNRDILVPNLNLTIIQAIFQILKGDEAPLTSDEIIRFTEKINLSPSIPYQEQDFQNVDRFSFVIHPLSIKDIFLVPQLKFLGKKKFFRTLSEKFLHQAPGFHYGKIRNIQSQATGKRVEGDLFVILDTPKMMMRADKEFIYKKLVGIARAAKSRGSKIMGLGAYTKIVGDAGVTVAERSPLPITTGNSLSAAATLWAASYSIQKMNFVPKKNGKYQGTVMVVGATGSIGKVCSKILAQYWKQLVLVAPRPYKLVDLSQEIKEIAPDCEIVYSTGTNGELSKADLVITTTSAQGRKILDIDQVKPGAVICDVSRPFDISLEDCMRRPDVLVVASGEVELPGDVKLDVDIGLSGTTVYACLAETALLALEGRHEPFSLSREINYQKVLEIDALARKHGVKLSAIMGHQSEITADEILLCRDHALKRRVELGLDQMVQSLEELSKEDSSGQGNHHLN
jgi:predicted amino acid dehydrogenase